MVGLVSYGVLVALAAGDEVPNCSADRGEAVVAFAAVRPDAVDATSGASVAASEVAEVTK